MENEGYEYVISPVAGETSVTNIGASSVLGGSASTIMATTSGTYIASTAALAGTAGTAGATVISSGLATIGSIVEGGMAAGAIITTIVPIIVIGGTSYGVLKVLKK